MGHSEKIAVGYGGSDGTAGGLFGRWSSGDGPNLVWPIFPTDSWLAKLTSLQVHWTDCRKIWPLWWRRWHLHVWCHHSSCLPGLEVFGEEAHWSLKRAEVLASPFNNGTFWREIVSCLYDVPQFGIPLFPSSQIGCLCFSAHVLIPQVCTTALARGCETWLSHRFP